MSGGIVETITTRLLNICENLKEFSKEANTMLESSTQDQTKFILATKQKISKTLKILES